LLRLVTAIVAEVSDEWKIGRAFLDKVGVWSYAYDCIQDIAAVLVARRRTRQRTLNSR
jgi:hypothetical protein